ncbi:MAG: YqaJ viral recombinase family protein [Deltaproteobacteria bacterium]
MDGPQWLEERRRGIGGSDVSAILGMNPWRTAFQVYQEKRKEVSDWQGNKVTDWGKRMEPAIRQWYSDATGRNVRVPEKILYHAQYPFMLASLDGFTDDGRVVEIKTARSSKGWGEPGTAEIPDYYALQCQHYMIVTGFRVADVPVSIGGGSPELYEVPADLELQEFICEAAAAFWKRVVEGNPPAPVSYADAISMFGRSGAEGVVLALPETTGAVTDLRAVREQITALEAKEEEIKAKLIIALGESGSVLSDESGQDLVTYRLANGRKSFDAKALERDMPDVYAKYLKQSESVRRFLLK